MYNIIKTVITSGSFELTDIIRKIDTVWLEGKITDEEKAELVEMAQGKANPHHSLDLIKKVEEIDKRVRILETYNKTSDTEEPEAEETYPAFVEGKWYYSGDKVNFDGKNYTCIAPDGVACVWSPSAYPPYWQLEE